MMGNSKNPDVIIIGGSYAGLSAAMSLGRSLRNVLVLDSGLPCNRQTPHSHNFITHDGEAPAAIAALARQQVEKYGTVKFHSGLAVKGAKTAGGFEIATQSGEIFHAKKLVFATGIKDILPDIGGLAECWGITAIHCPYCHGYEARNEETGILANGDAAMHVTQLVNNLTKKLAIFTNGPSTFTTEQANKLEKHGIPVIETEIESFEHNKGKIENIVFRDGSRRQVTAVYVRASFVQHSDIPAALGCELTEQGHIKVDMLQRTSVPGVFACGDNCAMMRSVATAVATGNIAGAAANNELAGEAF